MPRPQLADRVVNGRWVASLIPLQVARPRTVHAVAADVEWGHLVLQGLKFPLVEVVQQVKPVVDVLLVVGSQQREPLW